MATKKSSKKSSKKNSKKAVAEIEVTSLEVTRAREDDDIRPLPEFAS